MRAYAKRVAKKSRLAYAGDAHARWQRGFYCFLAVYGVALAWLVGRTMEGK
jgi:hypothetical protein